MLLNYSSEYPATSTSNSSLAEQRRQDRAYHGGHKQTTAFNGGKSGLRSIYDQEVINTHQYCVHSAQFLSLNALPGFPFGSTAGVWVERDNRFLQQRDPVIQRSGGGIAIDN